MCWLSVFLIAPGCNQLKWSTSKPLVIDGSVCNGRPALVQPLGDKLPIDGREICICRDKKEIPSQARLVLGYGRQGFRSRPSLSGKPSCTVNTYLSKCSSFGRNKCVSIRHAMLQRSSFGGSSAGMMLNSLHYCNRHRALMIQVSWMGCLVGIWPPILLCSSLHFLSQQPKRKLRTVAIFPFALLPPPILTTH